MTDSELRRQFVIAHDEILPPAPALQSRVAEAVRHEFPAAGRRGSARTPGWQIDRSPRLMALVAAVLAVAIVIGLVVGGRALHLRSTTPVHPPVGHPFAVQWSQTIVQHPGRAGTFGDIYPNLGFTSDGFVFIVDGTYVVKLSASDGHESLRWPTLGDGPGQFSRGPNEIAVNGQNNLYATDSHGDKVVEWDETGKFLREWSIGQGAGLTGIGIDAAGEVYVGRFGQSVVNGQNDNIIQVFSPDGRLLRAFGRAGTGDGEFQPTPCGCAGEIRAGVFNIVVEADGRVWASDHNRGRLYLFSGDGQLLMQAGTGTLHSPSLDLIDVFPGLGGHVYAEMADGVHEFDASGDDLGLFGAGITGLPHHQGYFNVPVADSNGNLYVFDIYDSTIIKFSRR